MSTFYTGVLRLKLKAGKRMQWINLTPLFEDLKTLLLLIWTKYVQIELLTIRLFGEMSVSGSKSDKCQTLVVGEWSLRVKCSLDLDPYQQLSPLWVPTETSGKRWLARQVVGQQDHLVSDVASLAILSALKKPPAEEYTCWSFGLHWAFNSEGIQKAGPELWEQP